MHRNRFKSNGLEIFTIHFSLVMLTQHNQQQHKHTPHTYRRDLMFLPNRAFADDFSRFIASFEQQ